MRIYKNKPFHRFAKQEGIQDDALREAIDRIERGLIDADLGGGVIKQRIARSGEGKSGGYRTIILFRYGDRAFFVYGFSKSAKANVSRAELRNFRELARLVIGFSETELNKAIEDGWFIEVKE